MAIGTAIRMAGPNLFKFLKGGMSNQDLAARLMGDVFGGGMAAFYTPGDLGDKAIAGITDAAFSGALGLGAGRLVGPNAGILGFGADMAGSMLGMEVGRAAGDQAMRVKDSVMGGKGETPFERMSTENQAAMQEQVREQVLAQYGLLPGTRPEYYGRSSYLQELGLA